jgi:NAD(P)-dependent dehydrogenase (short-subunit alcohol dehydrogenase family)
VYLTKEQKDAEDTLKEVSQKTQGKRRVHLIPVDVKSEENCRAAVEETVKVFGRLDVLFNNAAQQLENHDILSLDSKQWEETFQVNVRECYVVV